MTPQSIFDRVTEHLFTQGVAAVDPHSMGCAYRSSDGLSCAVGCLLDDDTYEPRFEGYNLGGMFAELDPETLPQLFHDHYTLLSQLQTVHDHEMPRFKVTEEMAKDESYSTDNAIYVKDMNGVVRELRGVAAAQGLTFNEALVPERFRDAG